MVGTGRESEHRWSGLLLHSWLCCWCSVVALLQLSRFANAPSYNNGRVGVEFGAQFQATQSWGMRIGERKGTRKKWRKRELGDEKEKGDEN